MKAPKQEGGGGFEIPDGSYQAVCIMVIDCGMHDREWKEVHKMVRQIYLRWELPAVIIPDGEYAGERACIGSRYNFSMFKKANFRIDLQSWRGKPFTDDQANEFVVDSLAGASCTLQVFNKNGYSNVNSITPPHGKSDPVATPIVFDTERPHNYEDLPDWVKKKIHLISDDSHEMADEYSDVQSRQYAEEQDADAQTMDQADAAFDSDTPF